ncbi:MAG: hypothetical protein WAW69_16570, partial [Polaromonas sp.]
MLLSRLPSKVGLYRNGVFFGRFRPVFMPDFWPLFGLWTVRSIHDNAEKQQDQWRPGLPDRPF